MDFNFKSQVDSSRAELHAIFQGKVDKKILIIGPCSAWPVDAFLDYARRLLPWKERLAPHVHLVLRAYTQKSRTQGAWAGLMKEPEPGKGTNIQQGMRTVKTLFEHLLAMGHSLADEAVFLHGRAGVDAYLSWLAVGARSVENPEHRIFASFCPMPVGFKNPRDGQIEKALFAIEEAEKSQEHYWEGEGVKKSEGNASAHLVLRGDEQGLNVRAENGEKIQKAGVNFLVDLSHDNAKIQGEKKASHQLVAYEKTQEFLKNFPSLKALHKGWMLESFLLEGNQQEPHCLDGLSLTDPCLSWAQTEAFLTQLCHEYSC